MQNKSGTSLRKQKFVFAKVCNAKLRVAAAVLSQFIRTLHVDRTPSTQSSSDITFFTGNSEFVVCVRELIRD